MRSACGGLSRRTATSASRLVRLTVRLLVTSVHSISGCLRRNSGARGARKRLPKVSIVAMRTGPHPARETEYLVPLRRQGEPVPPATKELRPERRLQRRDAPADRRLIEADRL